MGLAEGSSEEELYIADDETTDEEAKQDRIRILVGDKPSEEEKWYTVAIHISPLYRGGAGNGGGGPGPRPRPALDSLR